MITKGEKYQPFKFKAGMDLSRVNIGRLLEVCHESFRSSGNPFHAWCALHFCVKARKPLPHWITTYLAGCSGRMLSKSDASDLRGALPEIFGFPKKRRGPGKPLSNGPRPDKESFTEKFMSYILQGNDPKTARANACNDMSRRFADKYDDRTLVKILVECMGLPGTPRETQWVEIVSMWMAEELAIRRLWYRPPAK